MSKNIRALDAVVVTEKKKSVNFVTVLAVLVIAALFVFSGVLAVYVDQNINSQNQSKQIARLQNQLNQINGPKLLSVGLQFYDNRSDSNVPFLQVEGYVVNIGAAEANNCAIFVTGIRDGNVTVLDNSASIPSLAAGAYETVNLQFPYIGQALITYTSYLSWTE